MASLAAEFPNDNPDLHEGVIWVCLDVTGAPSPERRVIAIAAPEPEPEPEPEAPPARASGIFMIADAPFEIELEAADEEIVVEELTPLDDGPIEIVGSEPPAPETASAPDDPFMVLVNALVDVAIAQGSPFVASQLPALLIDGRIEPGVDVDDAVVKTAHAWQGILRGTSEDWDAIGGAMLDEWAAELLARLLNAGDRAQLIKRELRARGIAGFGLAA